MILIYPTTARSDSRPESAAENSRKPHPAASERPLLPATASPLVQLEEPVTTLKPKDEVSRDGDDNVGTLPLPRRVTVLVHWPILCHVLTR